jgi:hypothetical protein
MTYPNVLSGDGRSINEQILKDLHEHMEKNYVKWDDLGTEPSYSKHGEKLTVKFHLSSTYLGPEKYNINLFVVLLLNDDSVNPNFDICFSTKFQFEIDSSDVYSYYVFAYDQRMEEIIDFIDMNFSSYQVYLSTIKRYFDTIRGHKLFVECGYRFKELPYSYMRNNVSSLQKKPKTHTHLTDLSVYISSEGGIMFEMGEVLLRCLSMTNLANLSRDFNSSKYFTTAKTSFFEYASQVVQNQTDKIKSALDNIREANKKCEYVFLLTRFQYFYMDNISNIASYFHSDIILNDLLGTDYLYIIGFDDFDTQKKTLKLMGEDSFVETVMSQTGS